ncbi:hypothetical protein HK096_011021 [Nowakowskiella sp. JEL0078]|nr:hypothetical protein HK096_011021 [Nowakowskiella sp. JEL0078]
MDFSVLDSLALELLLFVPNLFSPTGNSTSGSIDTSTKITSTSPDLLPWNLLISYSFCDSQNGICSHNYSHSDWFFVEQLRLPIDRNANFEAASLSNTLTFYHNNLSMIPENEFPNPTLKKRYEVFRLLYTTSLKLEGFTDPTLSVLIRFLSLSHNMYYILFSNGEFSPHQTLVDQILLPHQDDFRSPTLPSTDTHDHNISESDVAILAQTCSLSPSASRTALLHATLTLPSTIPPPLPLLPPTPTPKQSAWYKCWDTARKIQHPPTPKVYTRLETAVRAEVARLAVGHDVLAKMVVWYAVFRGLVDVTIVGDFKAGDSHAGSILIKFGRVCHEANVLLSDTQCTGCYGIILNGLMDALDGGGGCKSVGILLRLEEMGVSRDSLVTLTRLKVLETLIKACWNGSNDVWGSVVGPLKELGIFANHGTEYNNILRECSLLATLQYQCVFSDTTGYEIAENSKRNILDQHLKLIIELTSQFTSGPLFVELSKLLEKKLLETNAAESINGLQLMLQFVDLLSSLLTVHQKLQILKCENDP